MPSHLPSLSTLIATTLLTLFPAALPAQDWSAWSASADLIVDTSPGAISLAGPIAAYPLLVRLRAPGFPFAQARGRGQDLRFANARGALLPHEIETWDSAAGRADVWVLAYSILPGNATQSLRLYWGNAAAADSSRPGAVFPGADGLVAAWHLGGEETEARPNAVPGGNAAWPMAYEGDESRPGLIGLCDSLGAESNGDYLDAGSGFADWTMGFTYTAWVKPAALRTWGRLMDFGNGAAADNLILGMDAGTSNLAVHMYPGVGNTHSRLNSGPYFALNRWQHVAVTIDPADSSVKAYHDGAQVWTSRLIAPIRDVERTMNWLGRSHWAADQYWQGQYDEVRLHRRVLDPGRIRLDFATQQAGSGVVSLRIRPACAARFAAPGPVTADEGLSLTLAGTADCATRWSWTVAHGVPVRLVDPSSKEITFTVPRVAGDTQVTLLFRADMPDSQATATVTVRIRETIPDPRFTLPDTAAWGTADSLVLQPAFSNLAAVKASRDSAILMEWSVEGVAVDTVWRGYGLVLRRPAASGLGRVTACASNGGPAHCETVIIVAGGGPLALRPAPGARSSPGKAPRGALSYGERGWHRTDGRRVRPEARPEGLPSP